MELFYDLHIHSCLSPCGNDDCTPANIAMLAQMLGLQAVALTDHNTCKNCPAFFKAAEQAGILPIAGMELTVQEEFHVLCLFPQLDQAMKFDELVHQQLLPFKNDKSIYGNQLIVDSEDTNIFWSTPHWKPTSSVFKVYTHKTLNRADKCTVNHDWGLLGAIGVSIL